MNQIGDLLFSLPAVYNLKQRFPNACITSVVRPGCRDLIMLSDLPDEVLERTRGRLLARLELAATLRREHPDLAVLFSRSFENWALAMLSGAKIRVGFKGLTTGRMLHYRVRKTGPPSTENNLRLVEAIGCPVTKKDYVGLIGPGDRDREAADQLLDSMGVDRGQAIAVLSPGTSPGREIKRWTDEGFARVADGLKAELGLTPVVVGTDGGERICRLSEHALDATGKTSLPVLAAVLSRANVFVGIDSGIMHLAPAVGTPVVGLFGPTDPGVTGPQGEGHVVITAGLDCAPCGKTKCPDPVCMHRIEVSQIVQAAAMLREPIGN